MNSKQANEIIATVEGWFAKAPALPTNAREILVKIAPIISLVFGILGLLGGVAGLGILTTFLPVAAYGRVTGYGSGFLAALFLVVSSGIMIAAYSGLKKRQMGGWTLLFWSEVLSLIYNIVSFDFLSAIIGALIGFYLLFQIKSYYK